MLCCCDNRWYIFVVDFGYNSGSDITWIVRNWRIMFGTECIAFLLSDGYRFFIFSEIIFFFQTEKKQLNFFVRHFL